MSDSRIQEHGGNLSAARQRFGERPAADPERCWIDLSTGISPWAYPVPPPPAGVWRQLPELDGTLEAVAAAHYGVDPAWVTVVPGSQAAIGLLPQLLPARTAAIPWPEYSEHAHAWATAGRDARRYPVGSAPPLDGVQAWVLSEPNNPTGRRVGAERIEGLARHLAQRNAGTCVVDAAFADALDETATPPPSGHCWVLRSLGKFFGLAGARIGFLLAPPEVGRSVTRHLGPWPVSGPARWAATFALGDGWWARRQRQRLAAGAARLRSMLEAHGLRVAGGTPLYAWVPLVDGERATRVQERLARHGVWTRCFHDPPGVRFGLPGPARHWQRLEAALAELSGG